MRRVQHRAWYLWALVLMAIGVGTSWGRVAPTLPGHVVTLHALDKIAGRVQKLEVTIDQPVRFETLEIRLQECRHTSPEEEAEAAAFLEIADHGPGAETGRLAFSGWMFASSPSLSALEHPIYEIWITGCR